ncbi:FecR family protein [Oceanospirillum maris]|uniref:FecR family protein n=1 Tax=Oceanospirillum maris TaxID=64977 RepID=UPI0003F7415E|nr:FecR family protein [Oceanospirillum maris]
MNTLPYQISRWLNPRKEWGRGYSTYHSTRRSSVAYFWVTLPFLMLFLLTVSVSALAASGAKAAKEVVDKEAVGKLMFTHGQVSLERSIGDIEDNGSSEQLSATRGDSVFEGDRIITAAASSAQIRFTDGGTMALRPNSEMVLTRYSYQKNDGKESTQTTDLVRGGLRSITGAIGHTNPQNVSYRTPVATIGIRGTIIQLLHFEPGSPDLPAGSQPGSYLMVEQGAAAATTSSTRLIRAGQALVMFSPVAPPAGYPADDAVFGTAPPQGDRNANPRRPGNNQGLPPGNGSRPPPESNLRLPAGDADPSLWADDLLTDNADDQKEQITQQESDDVSQDLEQACRDEGFASCASKDAFLAAEQVCQSQGFASCASRNEILAAEQACRAEGYASCALKNAVLESEAACRAEGYDSCSVKEFYLLLEAECQAEGYASCSAKDEFLAAEQVCQAEGYESCSAKDEFLAAEQVCQAEGYASCSAKDEFLAAEQVCQAEGYESCAAKDMALVTCTGLGYAHCDQMMGDSSTNPLTSSGAKGLMFTGLSGTAYRFEGGDTSWMNTTLTSGETVPYFIGADTGSIRYQRRVPDSKAEAQSIHYTYESGASAYLGYWPAGDYSLLDTDSLELLITPDVDLVYSAASTVMTDPDEITSLMNTASYTFDFLMVADTTELKPVLGDMVLNSAQLNFDTMDQKLRGIFTLLGATDDIFLESYDGVSISEFLTSGMPLAGFHYSSPDNTTANGFFSGGFAGDSGLIDGAFGVLSVEVSSLGLQDDVAILFEHKNIDVGLLGLPNDLGLSPGVVAADCSLFDCTLGLETIEGNDISFGFTGPSQSSLIDSSVPGGNVYWGYWSENDYMAESSDPAITPASLGDLPYIFTDALPVLKDITELEELAAGPVVTFSFVGGGNINNLAGSYLSDGSVSLDFTSSTMDINLDFGSDGGLEAIGADLPDLSGFDYLALTPTSVSNFDSGTLSGRFAGTKAEALMLMIETMGDFGNLDGRGTALMERPTP